MTLEIRVGLPSHRPLTPRLEPIMNIWREVLDTHPGPQRTSGSFDHVVDGELGWIGTRRTDSAAAAQRVIEDIGSALAHGGWVGARVELKSREGDRFSDFQPPHLVAVSAPPFVSHVNVRGETRGVTIQQIASRLISAHIKFHGITELRGVDRDEGRKIVVTCNGRSKLEADLNARPAVQALSHDPEISVSGPQVERVLGSWKPASR